MSIAFLYKIASSGLHVCMLPATSTKSYKRYTIHREIIVISLCCSIPQFLSLVNEINLIKLYVCSYPWKMIIIPFPTKHEILRIDTTQLFLSLSVKLQHFFAATNLEELKV